MRLRANTKKRKAAHVWASAKSEREAAADTVQRLARPPLRFGEVVIGVDHALPSNASVNAHIMAVEMAGAARTFHLLETQAEFERVFGRHG